MAKVSVIVPCYNQGQYVDEAVDSVLAQTFQDFEIIIVNDGSTDDFTNDKLRNYDRPKTTVIHTTNQGLAAARNNGLRASSGKYIQFLDADDLLESNKILNQIFFLENNKTYSLCYCNTIRFKENISNKESYYYQPINKLERPLIDLLRNDICFPLPVHSLLIAKEVFQKVGFFDEELKAAEDRDFWMRVIMFGYKIFHLDFYGVYYRGHSESMNTDNKHIYIGMYKFTMKMEKMLIERHLLDYDIRRILVNNYLYVLKLNRQYNVFDEDEITNKINRLKTRKHLCEYFHIVKQKLGIRSRIKK